jgi:hypothetical protein
MKYLRGIMTVVLVGIIGYTYIKADLAGKIDVLFLILICVFVYTRHPKYFESEESI